MPELDEIQCCLGCKKRINLLETTPDKAGYRCLDCTFYFCRPCAEFHFNKTDVSPSEKDRLLNALKAARYELYKAGQALDFLKDEGGRNRAWEAERIAENVIRVSK